jgi:hypothetical protein
MRAHNSLIPLIALSATACTALTPEQHEQVITGTQQALEGASQAVGTVAAATGNPILIGLAAILGLAALFVRKGEAKKT